MRNVTGPGTVQFPPYPFLRFRVSHKHGHRYGETGYRHCLKAVADFHSTTPPSLLCCMDGSTQDRAGLRSRQIEIEESGGGPYCHTPCNLIGYGLTNANHDTAGAHRALRPLPRKPKSVSRTCKQRSTDSAIDLCTVSRDRAVALRRASSRPMRHDSPW